MFFGELTSAFVYQYQGRYEEAKDIFAKGR